MSQSPSMVGSRAVSAGARTWGPAGPVRVRPGGPRLCDRSQLGSDAWEGAPYLDLLCGVGERQCVDPAGGQARLEGFRAVPESHSFLLSRRGALGCFRK